MYLTTKVNGKINLIFECIVLIFCVGIVLLAAVWCGYFLSRVREIGRKIHYLKKQREERCYEELINAKVDYIKSIFIVAISAFEIFSLIFFFCGIFIHNVLIHEHKHFHCKDHTLIGDVANFTFIRGLLALEISSELIYTSLIHILTSYLSHAYAIKRVISLARRDKVLLAWLLIQLIVIWISIAYWRAFISIIIIIIICSFPINLCLYIKYSRSLYLLLKWRRLDAWFEDPQSHKRLDGMCKEYKTGSTLYVTSMVLLVAALTTVFLLALIEMVFDNSCLIDFVFFNWKNDWLKQVYKQHENIIKICISIINILRNIIVTFVFVFLFALHLYIMWKAVKTLWKRRVAYKNGAKEMYRPLLANN